jgi:hypothetical protein
VAASLAGERRSTTLSDTVAAALGSFAPLLDGETEKDTVTATVRAASDALSGVGSGVVDSCAPW